MLSAAAAASCNGSFMHKFYPTPSSHAMISRAYPAYPSMQHSLASSGTNGSGGSLVGSPNSSGTGSGSGLNNVSVPISRYSTAGYSPHMQAAAAAVAAQQQFSMPNPDSVPVSASPAEDWYGKGFAGTLRMNPLQYQA